MGDLIEMEIAVQLMAVLSGFVAAITLFYGSFGVPFEEQSYKGETPPELQIKRRQKIMNRVGIPAVVISTACQLILVFWPAA